MSFKAGFGQTPFSVLSGLGLLAFAAVFIYLQISSVQNGGRYPAGVFAGYAAGIGILFSTLLPNFTHLLPAWWGLYGWFFGVAIGGASYWALRMLPEVDPQLARRT